MPDMPHWQPLDALGDLVAAGRTGGRIVGIVAADQAIAAGWAEHAAISLAKEWSAAGQKVMLVDGSLREPVLHRAVGATNGEGLSDATLYGASVTRVAHRIQDGGFFVVTAGTAIADPGSVPRHERWGQLTRGFVEAGVTLGVFVPDDADTAPIFLGSASEIVVLAGPSDPPPAAVSQLQPLVTMVTGPGGPVQVDATVDLPVEAPAEAVAVATAEKGGRSKALLLVVLLLALLVLVLGLFGVVEVPGITPLVDSVPISAERVADLG